MLAPKDFVSNRLCRPAHPVTDPITPFDIVGEDGAYDADVLGLVAGLSERSRASSRSTLVGEVPGARCR